MRALGISAADRRRWVESLRYQGIKAAHPDDGWVNRRESKVHLAYPDFDDGLDRGDLLALGWPWTNTRIVRVTGFSPNQFAVENRDRWYVHFTELEKQPRKDNMKEPDERC